jgi:hypothetical protein
MGRRNRLLVIADASESALACWTETCTFIAELLLAINNDLVPEITVMGTGFIGDRDEWAKYSSSFPDIDHAPSLIGPLIESVYDRINEVIGIIIVGSGEVYDLLDWIRNLDNWFLVCTGSQPLAPSGSGLKEWLPTQLTQIISLISVLKNRAVKSSHQLMNGTFGQDWDLDRSGFPLLFVPPLAAYIHLFPILRAQFEVFLSDNRSNRWGDEWYSRMSAAMTKRIPIWNLTKDNYEAVFLGGVLPDEIYAFQTWCGNNYYPLTLQCWLAGWKWLAGQPVSVIPIEIDNHLNQSARELWHFALTKLPCQTLLDLTFMRHGMVEWVKTPANEWTGTGKPRRIHPFHDPINDMPLKPTSISLRATWYSFRLLRGVV